MPKKLLATTLLLTTSTVLQAESLMPMHLVNETGLDDAQLYFTIKAKTFGDEQDCLVSVDLDSGLAQCSVVEFGDDAGEYVYSFEQVKDIKLPKMVAARMYFSVDYPVELYINSEDKVDGPDGFKTRDVNYYKVYDKIEFTYNDGGSWTNPTAVDFFGMPIRIEQENQHGSELEASGFYEPRQSIIEQLGDVVSTYDQTDSNEWQQLFITFNDDADAASKTLLRFMAPGKAMTPNVNTEHYFDLYYLNDKSSYQIDYIDSIWEYYKSNTLKINAKELDHPNFPDLGHYEFSGQVDPETDLFVFTNGYEEHDVELERPETSMPFFAGAGDEFDHVNNTPKAIVVRQFTSAFEVGLLPAPDNTVIDRDYFISKKDADEYYQDNPLLNAPACSGPWYDLYAKALHSFGDDQYIYAFAYSDALAMDGTLHDPDAGAITVTLGDLSGLEIPNPYDDDTVYTVNPILGDEASVTYTDADGNQVPLQTNAAFEAPVPLNVNVNGHDTQVYIKYPIVTPFYDGADGIVIEQTSANEATIIFPSP